LVDFLVNIKDITKDEIDKAAKKSFEQMANK
jgi:hypothetical protein